MIADEIYNALYLEYDLNEGIMTIHYRDGSSVSIPKTISEFSAFDRLMQSRGKYG